MTHEDPTLLKPVIVRTYSAGAHFGYLVSRDGKEVTLDRSRRESGDGEMGGLTGDGSGDGDGSGSGSGDGDGDGYGYG